MKTTVFFQLNNNCSAIFVVMIGTKCGEWNRASPLTFIADVILQTKVQFQSPNELG